MTDELPTTCRVVAWNPPVSGIAEVLHAHLVDYHYPVHAHDTWTVLIVDDGQVRYDLDTRHHGAAGRTVTVLPPDVAHDGRPVDQQVGFRKRNLYLDADFLPIELVGHVVDQPLIDDPVLHRAVSSVHHALLDHPDPMEIESQLALVAERVASHLDPREPREPASLRVEPELATRLRAYLDGHVTESIRLADAAAHLERSVPHLIRTFTSRYGISPHAYLIGKRIDRARRALLDGATPARVAIETGFADQAHLTRHFTRHVSIPPARYAASHRER